MVQVSGWKNSNMSIGIIETYAVTKSATFKVTHGHGQLALLS